jgi:hypothetical protein
MDTLVAIPKAKIGRVPVWSERVGLSKVLAESVDEGRSTLLSFGLDELPIESARVKNWTGEKSVQRMPGDLPRGFVYQDNIGAFIINAGRTTVKSAQEALGEDFHIIPDVSLSVPVTSESREVAAAVAGPEWPAASGIRAAHDSGITGKGVIIAVVDTGCDADHREFSERHVEFRYFPPTKPQAARAHQGDHSSRHQAEQHSGKYARWQAAGEGD